MSATLKKLNKKKLDGLSYKELQGLCKRVDAKPCRGRDAITKSILSKRRQVLKKAVKPAVKPKTKRKAIKSKSKRKSKSVKPAPKTKKALEKLTNADLKALMKKEKIRLPAKGVTATGRPRKVHLKADLVVAIRDARARKSGRGKKKVKVTSRRVTKKTKKRLMKPCKDVHGEEELKKMTNSELEKLLKKYKVKMPRGKKLKSGKRAKPIKSQLVQACLVHEAPLAHIMAIEIEDEWPELSELPKRKRSKYKYHCGSKSKPKCMGKKSVCNTRTGRCESKSEAKKKWDRRKRRGDDYEYDYDLGLVGKASDVRRHAKFWGVKPTFREILEGMPISKSLREQALAQAPPKRRPRRPRVAPHLLEEVVEAEGLEEPLRPRRVPPPLPPKKKRRPRCDDIDGYPCRPGKVCDSRTGKCIAGAGGEEDWSLVTEDGRTIVGPKEDIKNLANILEGSEIIIPEEISEEEISEELEEIRQKQEELLEEVEYSDIFGSEEESEEIEEELERLEELKQARKETKRVLPSKTPSKHIRPPSRKVEGEKERIIEVFNRCLMGES